LIPRRISNETKLVGIERRVSLRSNLYGAFKAGNALLQAARFKCLEQDSRQETCAVTDSGIEFSPADLIDSGT
jgi:hypothetical protein